MTGLCEFGASGAAALIVNVGGETGKDAASGSAKAVAKTVKAGSRTYNLLILTEGEVPEPVVEGEQVKIGGQTISCDGQKIILGKSTPAK